MPVLAHRIALGLVLASLGGATLGHAEVYKWVDERGVVNYGSAPPPQARAQALDPQVSGVSVVPALAPAPPQASEDGKLRERVERLESELQQQRQERFAAAEARAREQAARLAACERDRVVDCDGYGRGVGYPAAIVVQRPPFRQHRPPFIKPGPFPKHFAEPGGEPLREPYFRMAPQRGSTVRTDPRLRNGAGRADEIRSSDSRWATLNK